ncbi:MAG: GAF domain-containing protein [Pseudomonadota bacterium]|jgi:two-component system nitrate/nitrite sensor histidine kinase NarX
MNTMGPAPAPVRSEEGDVQDAEEQGGYKLQALRILSEVSAKLACEHNLEALLERFLDTLMRLSGAAAGAVRVLTTDGRRLRLLGALGLPDDVLLAEQETDLDCGICGVALREDDVRRAFELKTCAERTGLPFFHNCSGMVVVPLKYRGKVLGVYNLFLRERSEVPEDLALLFTSISEHLGMALENARLMRENLRMTLIDERQMIANEVHDSLAQTMAYMKMRLSAMQEALQQDDKARALAYVADAQQALDTAYGDLRELLGQFRHRMDPLGLFHAIDALALQLRERTGIELERRNDIHELGLSVDQEVQVFHILQEALANVARHSGATRARLTMETGADGHRFTVEDDGKGFVAAGHAMPRHHFGLSIMRERAERVGGCIELARSPLGGALVRLVVPVPPKPAARRP